MELIKNPQTMLTMIDDEVVVSHKTIAENTGNKEHSITKILRNNVADFEEFGRLGFEIHTLATNGGKQEVKTYYLNEQQSTLLITYLRNNDRVREFKKALVKAFFMMRDKLQSGAVANKEMMMQFAQTNKETMQALASVTANIKHLSEQVQNAQRESAAANRKLSELDIKVDRIGSVSIKTDIVLKDTYNYLRYQPLSREERYKLTERIKQRGKVLHKRHGISLDHAIAAIYRSINKAYSTTTYHELEHKDFASVYDFVDYIDIGGGFEAKPTHIEDVLEKEYAADDASTARDIYGDKIN